MVMEAFQGFDSKIQYDIIGHSGESICIPFIGKNNTPKNNKERLEILRVSELIFSLFYIIYIYIYISL